MTTFYPHPLRGIVIALALLLLAAILPGIAAAQYDEGIVEGRGEFEMVLIHGLGSRAEVWDEVLPFLKGTFKVRTFELAGHGQTQPVMNSSLEIEVQRLEKFIIEQGFFYPTLVGHGLGGMIALQYALDHPADVHRLILMDTAPKQLATDEQKTAVAKALVEDYDKFVASRFLNMGPDQRISDQVMDTALRTDSATFISLLMSSFDFDLTERLPKLTVPLLVMGSQLMFPNEETSQQVLGQIGFGQAHSLTFKRMAHTGHFMMLERPVQTASVLLAFGVSSDFEF